MKTAWGALAAVAVLVLATACSDKDPSSAASQATPVPDATATGTPAPPPIGPPARAPLPLNKQDPCRLLPEDHKAWLRGTSTKFTEKPSTHFGERWCQYRITRRDGSFFNFTFAIVEYGGMYTSTAGLPTRLALNNAKPLEPLAPIGHRHRGAFTNFNSDDSATYSISVTERSRVDVYFVAGTYRDNGPDGARHYAIVIEPGLP